MDCSETSIYGHRISACHLDYFSAAYLLLFASITCISQLWKTSQARKPPQTPATTTPEESAGERVQAPSIPVIQRAHLVQQLSLGCIALISLLAASFEVNGGPMNAFALAHLLISISCVLLIFQTALAHSRVCRSTSFDLQRWRNYHASMFMWYIWAIMAVIWILRLWTAVWMLVDPSSLDPVLFGLNRVWDVILSSGMLFCALVYLVAGYMRRSALLRGYALLGSGTSQPEPSAFANLFSKLRKLVPFMWPRKNWRLQVVILISVLLLVLGRVINLLVPLSYRAVINALADDGSKPMRFPVPELLIFVTYKFLQGSSGLVATLQSTFWIPAEQFTTRSVAIQMFEHLHRLSLRYHLNRKTGEVLRVMDRGTQAIASLVSYIFFNIVPVLVDIFAAVVFFMVQFDIYFGLVVLFTMFLYLLVTIWITEWRTKYRRTMIDLDNATNAKAVDSLLNFETVKYYGNEDFEIQNYQDCILRYQKADWVSQISLKILNSAQNFVIALGLLVGCLLCAKRIVDGQLNVGDFVLFITYLQQLYQPLNWFGTYYRMINQNFIDMEKMLDLFKENPEIKDDPDAKPLHVDSGTVVFDNVSFTYEPLKATSPSLHDISFEVKGGQTVALVGPSGGGKSSIFRLLFRFYDVQQGKILIDGQDIRHVTQTSLRQAIGVVPQDTVLFNDTIEYNIRYGNVKATEDEVRKAAEMAQIHDRILSFPEGYKTMVGERGLRLSGGEKQRVAIARTLLKQPRIVLLDEATSALDTTTERQIQKALVGVTHGRTTLVIAHRLSTIVGADLILVLKEGRIVERGTHQALLQMGGVYHELWHKQLDEPKEESAAQAK